MDWVLVVVVAIGWIIGFVLLDKLTMWVVIRMGWHFHTLDENARLRMNEGAQDRFSWEDAEEDLKK